MKRTLMLGFAGLLLLVVGGLIPVLSQDMGGGDACGGDIEVPEPKGGSQDPNGVLKKLGGDFELAFTLWMEPGKDPMKMTIPMTTGWALDEQFLKTEYEMKDGPFPHKGTEYLSYNEATKKYESLRLTSMSGSMVVYTGDYDAKAKKLTLSAEYKMDWQGESFDAVSRLEYVWESDDKYTMTGWSRYPGVEGMDKDMKEVEIIATRKKK